VARAEGGGDSELRLGGLGPSPCLQEKPRREGKRCPYRKPPLVGRGESPKANERTSAKELGKRAP